MASHRCVEEHCTATFYTADGEEPDGKAISVGFGIFRNIFKGKEYRCKLHTDRFIDHIYKQMQGAR